MLKHNKIKGKILYQETITFPLPNSKFQSIQGIIRFRIFTWLLITFGISLWLYIFFLTFLATNIKILVTLIIFIAITLLVYSDITDNRQKYYSGTPILVFQEGISMPVTWSDTKVLKKSPFIPVNNIKSIYISNLGEELVRHRDLAEIIVKTNDNKLYRSYAKPSHEIEMIIEKIRNRWPKLNIH